MEEQRGGLVRFFFLLFLFFLICLRLAANCGIATICSAPGSARLPDPSSPQPSPSPPRPRPAGRRVGHAPPPEPPAAATRGRARAQSRPPCARLPATAASPAVVLAARRLVPPTSSPASIAKCGAPAAWKGKGRGGRGGIVRSTPL